MSAPVSVVIPTRAASGVLGPCLSALVEGVIDGLVHELILADAGGDAPLAALAEAVGARLVAAPPGRGPQLAAGAAAARGRWLLFLHADTRLSPGWAQAVRHHIESRGEGRAGYGRLRFDSAAAMARVTAGWANLRSDLLGLPYGDQGLLIARPLYDAVGGHPPLPLMEDVAIARRLGRRRLAPLDCVALTSAGRYEAEGWLRRGAGNLWRLARYAAGSDPARLARGYDRAGDRRRG